MNNKPTWYPNADALKCSGSFKTAMYPIDRDGKVECGACGRKVGLRNQRTKQMAMHRRPAPVLAVDIETLYSGIRNPLFINIKHPIKGR